MNCIYCREKHSDKQMMSRELFVDLCHRAGEKGIIHITGGEPLLVPWLEEEIVNNKDVTRFALNTNLLKLPRKETLEALFRVKTSLDDYEAKRWNKMVGGNFFDKVVSNIKKVSEVVENTSISFTATHHTADRFEEFVKFCNREFPNILSVNASFVKGSSDSALTKEDIVKLFNATQYMSETSRQVFTDTHTKHGNNFPENLTIPCYLSKTERLFDEYGREYYCSHLYRDKVIAPGKPGKDPNCVVGCNAKFSDFNKKIHEILQKRMEV